MKWEGSEAVPANTLFNPATSPTPDVPYEESFIYDPDNTAGFSCDRDTGCIEWNFAGEYYVWASVTWNGTGSAGETLAGMIEYGSNCSFAVNRVYGTMTADSINQNGQIPIDRMIFTFADGNDTVRVRVYHTDAGGNDIGIVWIHVVQLNTNTNGIFDPP